MRHGLSYNVGRLACEHARAVRETCALLGETVVKEAFGLSGDGYQMESGELALLDSFGKALPLSIFVRLRR